MLNIAIIVDSPVEAVLDFKCCQLAGLNIEVLVRNQGPVPATVGGPLRFTAADGSAGYLDLYPFGLVAVAPGDVAALYGSMDADRLRQCHRFTLCDGAGRVHAGRIVDDPRNVNGNGPFASGPVESDDITHAH